MFFCHFFFSDNGVFRAALGALGKMFAEGAFTTVFLYTIELYPTVMRSVNYREFIFYTLRNSMYI